MSQGEDEVSGLEDRMTELKQSDTKKNENFPSGNFNIDISSWKDMTYE